MKNSVDEIPSRDKKHLLQKYFNVNGANCEIPLKLRIFATSYFPNTLFVTISWN